MSASERHFELPPGATEATGVNRNEGAASSRTTVFRLGEQPAEEFRHGGRVLERYGVRLRGVGGELRGPCPLPTHTSRRSRDSFSVSPARNAWSSRSQSCMQARGGKAGANILEFRRGDGGLLPVIRQPQNPEEHCGLRTHIAEYFRGGRLPIVSAHVIAGLKRAPCRGAQRLRREAKRAQERASHAPGIATVLVMADSA